MIWNQQVEHFREVARRTSLNSAGRSDRKQIPAEKKSAYVEILIRRSELIDRTSKEQDHVLVLVDVRRIAEVRGIDWVHQSVERNSEVLIVLRSETVGRIGSVGHNYRAVGDGDDATCLHVRVSAGRRRVGVELEHVSDLRDRDRKVKSAGALLMCGPSKRNERCQLAERPFAELCLKRLVPCELSVDTGLQ